MERRVDRIETRVADRACRKPAHAAVVEVGGIAADVALRCGAAVVGIVQRGVAVERIDVVRFAVFKTIVQDGGNHIHVVCIGGLGLNDGGQRDDLVERVVAGGDIGLQILHAGLKVVEEAAERRLHGFVFKEIVRIREEIALQQIILLVGVRDVGDKVVIAEIDGVARLEDLVLRVQAVFFEDFRKALDRDALREGDALDLLAEIRSGLQFVDQRLVIKVRLKVERACREVLHLGCKRAIQGEKLRLFNGVALVQNVGKLVGCDILRDRDGHRGFHPVDSEKVVGAADQI